MDEIEIDKTVGRCSISGRAFTEGEAFHTVIFETPRGYERQDISDECWQGPPPGVVCHFQTRLPVKEKPRKTFVDDGVLMDFFQRMSGEDEPRKLRFRFVLSLILMRKRLLKYEQTVRRQEGEFWEMRLVKDRSTHRVLHPPMSDTEIEELTRELSVILQGAGSAADLAEAAAPDPLSEASDGAAS
jgi:hypothetical protein